MKIFFLNIYYKQYITMATPMEYDELIDIISENPNPNVLGRLLIQKLDEFDNNNPVDLMAILEHIKPQFKDENNPNIWNGLHVDVKTKLRRYMEGKGLMGGSYKKQYKKKRSSRRRKKSKRKLKSKRKSKSKKRKTRKRRNK